MNKWCIPCVLLTIMSFINSAAGQSLEEYRWKNRLVFILNPNIDIPLEHEQVEVFNVHKDDLLERQLLIFILHRDVIIDLKGHQVDLEKSDVPHSDFQGLILIGKDGRVKLKEPFVVTAKQIFELIDAMPMRRSEIRESEKY